jgi:hypothetical protein
MNELDCSLVRLLERCREQDAAAWREFRQRFGRVARRALAGFGNLTPLEREEAEDTARVAVSLEIEGGRVKATTDGAVVGFLRTVITNAARDVWRRRRPGEPLPPRLSDRAPSPLARTGQRAELDCAERVILAWDSTNRFIFLMKLEGVSTAAIKADLARLFNVFLSAEAVDVRFFRLRADLRRQCWQAGHDD